MAMPLNIQNPLVNDAEPQMTSTAQAVVDAQNQPKPPVEEKDPAVVKRNKEFRQRIDTCKQYRKKLVPNWTTNIDYRRGKPFASQTDEDTIAVNLDWSMTKAKQAGLFSQVPEARLDHPPQTLVPWIPTFQQKLNDTGKTAGIEATMDEVLPDVINAAGIGIAITSMEAILEDASVPTADPLTTLPDEGGEASGQMTNVPRVVDHRYVIQRISPADFLWPISFTGSDFNNAPWLGRSGRVTWAEAVIRWKLTEDDKSKVLGEDKSTTDKLTNDVEKDKTSADEMVSFDEIFYKEFQYDAAAKSYQTIHQLVFLTGKEDPIIDEPWKGQKVDPKSGMVIGSRKNPIQVLMLTYISDETIPPSDSAIGRPQVNEINKSRTQMIRQRERSLPVRWIDVNRIDPTIAQSLMRGTWQNFIPVQGEGSRTIGEVARASMPQENFAFDKIAKADWYEACTVGPNQAGSGAGVETSGEAKSIAASFQTRVGRERAKVASFFCNIMEVLGGLMCLFEDPASLGEGFDPTISSGLNYSIIADSTLLLDVTQKLERLDNFVNKYAKSGFVELEPVLKEIAMLTGLDPTTVIKAPEPKPPVEPNISLRLTGAADMMNPLMLAFMLKSGQAPPPELIEQAKKLIEMTVMLQPPPPPAPEGAMPGPGGEPPAGPQTPPVPGAPPPPGGGPVPSPPPPAVGDANPQAAILPTLDKRSDSSGKQ